MEDKFISPPEQQHLTSPDFWEHGHAGKRLKQVYPAPGKYLLDCELDRIFGKYLPSFAGRSILEVGCGSSIWLPYFAKKYRLKLYGLDYSVLGLAHARDILSANGVNGELLEADLFVQARSGQPRVSALFSFGLIEHFSDTTGVLRTLGVFLEPGGLLISWLPNTTGRINDWSCRLNPGLRETYHVLDLEKLAFSHQAACFEFIEGLYCQFFDLTWLNLTRFSLRQQKWLCRFFNLLSLPQVILGRCFGGFIRSQHWSSGMIVVARKTGEA
jgi:SAM-dependent methyltransferase